MVNLYYQFFPAPTPKCVPIGKKLYHVKFVDDWTSFRGGSRDRNT